MNEEQWIALVEGVLSKMGAAGRTGHQGLALSLVELADLMDVTPASFSKSKDIADTAAFKAESRLALGRVLGNNHKIEFTQDAAVMLFRIGAQIAALDEAHHELVGSDPPYDPNKQWRIPGINGDIFLIPRQNPYRISRRGVSGSKIQLIRRDLMAFHRTLPTMINGFNVRLTWRDMAGDWPVGLKLAGAVFPNLKFEFDDGPTDFVITGIKCDDQYSQIRSYLETAHKERCAALVLPELTVPPTSLESLKAHLASRLLWANTNDGPSRPLLVVAGSWHESVGSNFVNVATIVDAHGDEILRHEKLLTFADADLSRERIRPGSILHVLATEETLIAFGICLDFCERGPGGPFPKLDVDFVLVPSCGNDRTMEGHLTTAKDMRARYRTRGLIVQQPYPLLEPNGTGQPLGYILPPNEKLDLRVSDTLVYEAWTVCESN